MIVEDFKYENGLWAKYAKDKKYSRTRAGSIWYGICDRCNPKGSQRSSSSSYLDVCNGFIDFDNFATWCQYQFGYKEGYQIDKDLLVKGNKFYAPDRCVFLPYQINTFIVSNCSKRGSLPIGVTEIVSSGKFTARCRPTGTSFRDHIGTYDTVEEAFLAYKSRKESISKMLAQTWEDKIDPRAYEALKNFTVDIND